MIPGNPFKGLAFGVYPQSVQHKGHTPFHLELLVEIPSNPYVMKDPNYGFISCSCSRDLILDPLKTSIRVELQTSNTPSISIF